MMMSLVVRKPVSGYFDKVQHKPGCTTTKDSLRLETSDLNREELYYPCSEKRRLSGAQLLLS